jgi:putative membrane protein
MMRVPLIPAALGAALVFSMGLGTATAAGMTKSEMQFLRNAAGGGKAEVTLGELGLQRAQSPEVRQFAQRMVDDHSKANQQLMDLAKQKDIKLSSAMPKDAKQIERRLSGLSGAAFDREYMKDMVKDHEKDVAKFQQEAKNGKDPEVQQFAAQTLPILEDHLKQAREVNGALMNMSNTNTTQPKAPSSAPATQSPEEQTQPSAGSTTGKGGNYSTP